MKLKLRRKLSQLRRYRPPPGWTQTVSSYVVSAITSAVSPRLAGRIKHALPLASLILVLTLGAVVGLVFALRSQTIESCASVPIPALTGLEDPTCRHFVSSNFAVQSKPGSTNLMAELMWQQVPGPLLNWVGLVGLTASSIFGSFTECSFFPEPCQLVELAFSLYGLVDLGSRVQQPLASSLLPPPAASPASLGRKLRQQPSPSSSAPGTFLLDDPRGSIGDAWASGSILIDSLQYLGAKASPITDSNAFIQHALALPPPTNSAQPSSIRPWFVNSTVVKLLPAPANAPCCDVRLERNAAAPGRYAIRLASSNVPDFPPTTSGSCPDRDLRCSIVSISIATDFSCWAPDSPSTQDYAGSPCSGQSRLDFTADYSISIGSWESVNENGLSEADAPSSRTFIYRTDKASFDASQHAPANGSSAAAWAVYGLDIPAIYEEHGADMAAWAALLVFAYGYGIAVNSYVAAGSLTAQQVSQASVHMRLDYYGWANGWWEQLNIYCCENTRPTYLSAIGNALGYAGLVEVGVAFVCICVYMLVYPRERNRFGFLLRMMTMAPQDRLLHDGDEEEGKADKAEKAAAAAGGGGGGGNNSSSFRQQSVPDAASSVTSDLEADQAASDGASVVASVDAIEMQSTRPSCPDKTLGSSPAPTKCL